MNNIKAHRIIGELFELVIYRMKKAAGKLPAAFRIHLRK